MELTRYTRKLKEKGATYCKIIPVSQVVTAEWVRLKCQFGCGAYGTRLSCPPFSPAPSLTKSMLRDFSRAIFVAFRVPGSASERASRRGKRKIIVSVERELFLDGYYNAFAMAFGPCNLCAQCDLTSACKYPDYARPSMEACGIDVYATARNAGFPLKVVRSYDEGCVYCGLILVGKRQSGAGAEAGRLPRTRAKAASKKEKRNAAK